MSEVKIHNIDKQIQQIRKDEHRRLTAYSRIRLGFEALINRPYYNAFLFIMLIPFLVAWNNLDFFLPIEFIPKELLKPCYTAISVLLAIALILCELVVIRTIGFLTARKFEKNLSVVFATSYDYECPIMHSCKFDKNNGVTFYEFYSDFPKSEWENKMDHIAERNNIHFVAPRSTYGGKRSNDSRFVKLFTQKGILPPERGTMHDKEL